MAVVALGDDIGQATRKNVGAACDHVLLAGRVNLESACAMQHVVAVDGGDGRDV
ncbi:hypothetical protein D3C71_2219560 [compost metagenome]